jgi:hypothetical protein
MKNRSQVGHPDKMPGRLLAFQRQALGWLAYVGGIWPAAEEILKDLQSIVSPFIK